MRNRTVDIFLIHHQVVKYHKLKIIKLEHLGLLKADISSRL